MTKKIGLISLGCAKNRVNSEQMLYLLREAGYEISGETQGADVAIVNTCGFIDRAKSEAIETILELAEAKARGDLAKIVVTGCLSERYREEMLAELPEIDAVLGVGSYEEIVTAVEGVLGGETVRLFGDKERTNEEIGRVITTSPSWEYIKIAEGCDNRCAYCAIPDIRGRFRSRPMENIVSEAADLAARGIRELIVISQDTTRYGTDIYGRRSLAELVRKLSYIDGLDWIRLHYLYPDELDDALITEIAENDKVLKYLDIPLQHISDNVLRKMNRRGTGAEIRALVRRLREKIPGVVLRTSLITGLPGEGEAEFEELCAFLKEARIERAGVFAFSPEEGTPAAAMPHVSAELAESRAEQIMALQTRIMDEYAESRVGSTEKVLLESYDGTYYYGRSFAESPEVDGAVLVRGAGLPIGGFVTVRITGVLDGEPVAEPAESEQNRGEDE